MCRHVLKYASLLFITSFSYNFTSLLSTIKFTNRNACIALADTNSKVKYNSGSFLGWNQQSIVKNSGSDSLKTGDVNNVITYALASEDLIVNNSNAIVKNTKDIRTSSNALLYGITNNSNAIIKNTRDILSNSNALLYGIKNNSNTIVSLDTYIDTQLDGAVRANSRNISYNSNALLNLDDYVRTEIDGSIRANSRNIVYNSNALLYGIVNNSNALVYGISNNSNAIIKNTRDILSNSNALLYGIKNNSNTIVSLDTYIDTQLDGAVRANSRNISYNSNALLNLDDYVRTEIDGSIRANSRNIVYNSNALVYGISNNSNAIIKNTRDILSNSNALLYGIKNNSNAIIALDTYIDTQLAGAVRANSRNIVYNSNTIKYQSDHFIVVNDGKFSAIGQISGHTTLNSKGFVENSINLNNRTLNLNGDLNIASGTTIDADGKFNLNGYSIILDGDLTLPTDTVITITSSGIIDGKNHNLNFNNHAQLFIDTNISLTLKNITVNNIVNPLTFPPIHLAASNTKLTLDNVKLACNNDFLFPEGQLFIHNDVSFTGTSKFIYQSTSNSYITKQSTLNFGPLTAFDFSPSCTNKNLINLQDSSSNIKFDGCTLQTTYTGLHLTKGNVIFDNKITISSGQYKINDLTEKATIVYNYYIYADVEWSPSGQFLAATCWNEENDIIVYSFDGNNLTQITTANFTSPTDISWSPDGKYLAVGGINGSEDVVVYSFNGTTLNQIAAKDHGTLANSVQWNPDGKYLAVGGNNGDEDVIIYSFDGTTLTQVTTKAHGSSATTTSWSPDGKYLAVGGNNGDEDVIIYSFDGTTLTQITTKAHGSLTSSVAWSPDGKFLAIFGDNFPNNLIIYYFDETNLVLIATENYAYDIQSQKVQWSPDGKYLLTSARINPLHLVIYDFDGSTLNQIISKNYGEDNNLHTAKWRPDGNYIAIGKTPWPIDLPNLIVYSVDKIFETTTQAFSNSIVLGDSSLDNSYNPNIIMQNSTRLEPYGSIYFDSAKLDFASKNASIALNNSNSRIKFNSVNNVYGWSEQSIIKSTGNNNSWLSDNIIYGNEIGDTSAPTDLVYSNSNTIVSLDTYIDTQLDGAVRANSRNISYNSNALLNLDDYVRTEIDGAIRANSRNIVYNSNALVYGISNNSNAIIKNIRDILSNSNALLYGIKNNSNTIIALDTYIDTQLDGAVRANSRNISYNSNALLNLDDYVRTEIDGAIRANSRNIVYNSNALLYGIVNNSNALVYGISNNSNAIIKNTRDILSNSNALLYGIKNNSNTIIALDNYIDSELAGTVRANSRNISYNSNALLNLDDYVRTEVDGAVRANSRNISYNSNALLYGITNNSNAIIKNTRDILSNSNALLYGIKNNSNTIIALDTYIDTQLDGAVRANSRNISYNSNALLNLDDYVRTEIDGAIRANSRNIVYNSNALVYGISNNSNAIIKNTRDILSNSNALIYGIKNNSNAIIAINSNIDSELAGAVRANSRNISYNSNALLNLDDYVRTEIDGNIRANSRNISYNSNALLYGIVNNSNALVYGISNNSNAIIKNTRDILSNSNALIYGIKNNSNAIIALDTYIDTQLDGAVRANSRNISYNSNAILTLGSLDLSVLQGAVRANSRNISYNSNAILTLGTLDLSVLQGAIRANSRNISYNSNAILTLGALDLSVLQGAVRANSRNISYNSNAILTLGALDLSVLQGAVRANSRNIVYNSNAIIASINVVGQGESYNIASDIDLGGTAANPQAFYLSRGISTISGTYPHVRLHAGVTFFSSPIDLNGGTLVLSGGDSIFSAGTTIESSGNFSLLNHAIVLGNDLTISDGVELTFTTSGILDGQDHNLILDGSSKLKLDNNVTLTIKNMHIKKLKDFSDDTSSICMNQSKSRLALQNAELCFDRDLSFTLGELYVIDDVKINGTNQLIYTSTQYLRIDKNSTFMFDINTSFSFAPIQAKNNLITMQDSTSQIFLNGASLKTTYTGIQLTKGTLKLDHKNYLYNQDGVGTGASNISQAIIFGDGITTNNDLYIEILPGASLDLKSGILDFRNLNEDTPF